MINGLGKCFVLAYQHISFSEFGKDVFGTVMFLGYRVLLASIFSPIIQSDRFKGDRPIVPPHTADWASPANLFP